MRREEVHVQPVHVPPTDVPPVHVPPIAEIVSHGHGRRRGGGAMWAVAALTILGGCFRFYDLNRPPFWTDEALTFWRICGSFSDLLATLEHDAFVPLHYELLWWVSHGLPVMGRAMLPGIWPTPGVMRFVPAAAGTAMIPAMYFLGRQFLGRRGALLAAAFACVSGFLNFYARDAKMYAPTWLFLTLAMGCFFEWARGGQRIYWLAWIFCGMAAAGLHATSLIIVGLSPVMFIFTRRGRSGAGWIMAVAGVLVILCGPALYYATFSRWQHDSGGLVPVGNVADRDRTGLGWVADSQEGRDGWDLFVSTASVYLTGYEWPRPLERGAVSFMYGTIEPGVLSAAVWVLSAFIVALMIAVMPWRSWRARDGGLPMERRNSRWILVLWLILPTYGVFYCRSIDGFTSPADWIAYFWGIGGWCWIAAGAAGFVLAMVMGRIRGVGVLAAAALAVLVGVTIRMAAREAGEVWFDQWLGVITQRWIFISVVATAAAVAWHFCGETARSRAARARRLVMMVGIVGIICGIACYAWRAAYAAVMRAHPDFSWDTIWLPRYVGIVWPAFAIAVVALIQRLPTRPLRWVVIVLLLGVNAAQSAARVVVGTEPRYDVLFADIFAARPDTATRTFVGVYPPFSLPTPDYYFAEAAGAATSPADFRNGRMWPFVPGPLLGRLMKEVVYKPLVFPGMIHYEAERGHASRVIVWTSGSLPSSGVILAGLGNSWRLSGEEVFWAHRYWTWAEGTVWRRREFVRTTK